jgi:hypothetical protein
MLTPASPLFKAEKEISEEAGTWKVFRRKASLKWLILMYRAAALDESEMAVAAGAAGHMLPAGIGMWAFAGLEGFRLRT